MDHEYSTGTSAEDEQVKEIPCENPHVQINEPSLHSAPVRLGDHRISSAHREQVLTRETFYVRTELDSHANTTVAGRNCVPIWHTERSCDVAPFSDTYEPMKDVAIVYAATGFTFITGRHYVLVFHECLYIPKLSHTLINTNQLRHFQTQVQDNPNAEDLMSITSPDVNFIASLESEGTNIFINIWSPTQKDLALLPHIELTSQQPWEPYNVAFPATKYYAKEEMESRNISSLTVNFRQSLEDPGDTPVVDEEDIIFDIQRLNRIIVASIRVPGTQSKEIEGSTIE